MICVSIRVEIYDSLSACVKVDCGLLLVAEERWSIDDAACIIVCRVVVREEDVEAAAAVPSANKGPFINASLSINRLTKKRRKAARISLASNSSPPPQLVEEEPLEQLFFGSSIDSGRLPLELAIVQATGCLVLLPINFFSPDDEPDEDIDDAPELPERAITSP